MKTALASLCLVLAACSPLLASLPSVASPPSIELQQNAANAQTAVIVMERTACFGSCPAYRLTIAGDGRVTYEGIAFVATQGTKTAQISPEQVEDLVTEFEKANFFRLKNEYTVNVTDLPGTKTAITLDGRSKQVWHYGSVGDPNLDNAPPALSRLEEAIDQAVNVKQWVGR
ncbi:hypothetical protein IFO70_03850 [Phormidium tenue FACHB-886]|nr:hypothetical protein [Phormidium tenue FACHB-886]